jgi:protein-S-isoprenylcysteine O-methyltransferase Ste14
VSGRAVPHRQGRALLADRGRLVVVPVVALLLLSDLWRLASHSGTGVLGWLTTSLVCAFYAVIIWCYLRRGPAVATSQSVTAHAAALIATFVPFIFPLLPGQRPGAAQQLAADALLAAGTAWAVWSLVFLGRNLSILAQARGVANRGPYRWVRHPLYTGELVSALGVALTVGSAAAMAVWLALCGLQAYRAAREEQVLLRALPEYRDYRRRTAALLPGIF